ncbi:MAG: class I SAM-dependent methyltransferase [Acidiferrobacterales bacterium]
MAHAPKNGLRPTTPHPPLAKYYAEEIQRRNFVVNLFDRTAPHYDWIDRAMSLGSGLRYRRDALRRAGFTRGMTLLDVAIGTGLIAKAALQIQGGRGVVTGVDVSIGMLQKARDAMSIPLAQGYAEQLPFRNSSVDFITMGFALRHVSDLESTFLEYRRVLKPGGTLLIMELTRPPLGTTKYTLSRFYMHRVVPLIARLGPGGADAQILMKYFWDTVDSCVPPETIVDALSKCGFARPSRKKILFSMFSEYVAAKPA